LSGWTDRVSAARDAPNEYVCRRITDVVKALWSESRDKILRLRSSLQVQIGAAAARLGEYRVAGNCILGDGVVGRGHKKDLATGITSFRRELENLRPVWNRSHIQGRLRGNQALEVRAT
jgi:hypothetical protein